MGFAASMMPTESIPILIINLSMLIIVTVTLVIAWQKYRENKRRHMMIHGYIWLTTLAIYFSLPLLRVLYGHYTFWICLSILMIMIVLPYLYAKRIVFGLRNPHKSKFGRISFTFIILLIFFGLILYRSSFNESTIELYPIAIYLYLAANLLFILAPGLLLKPGVIDKMDE